MNADLVVILLTYNHELTIEKAIDSILQQRVSFAYEVHILDDSSTDGTSEICRDYRNKFPSLVKHYRNERNLGVTRNLRNGIVRINANYFAFLEGDDYWNYEGKLQEQYDALENHPECSLCGHNVYINDLMKGQNSTFVSEERNLETGVYGLDDNLSIHPSSRLYRNCFDFNVVPEHMVLDTHMFLLYLDKGSLYYIDKVMSVYNKTGEGYWSGRNRYSKKLLNIKYRYRTAAFFNFKYDEFLHGHRRNLMRIRRIFGPKVGWKIYFIYESARIYLKMVISGAWTRSLWKKTIVN